jgi:Fe-S cluster biogenesis protein NfuA
MENAPQGIHITAEVTPNPNTLKFNVSRTLVEQGSLNFPDREKAKGSVFAERLFDIPSVIGVMVGRDFITITKEPAAQWPAMAEAIISAIREMFEKGQARFPQAAAAGAHPSDATGEIEQKIREILDNEIRPAVAMDGGDITFHGYYDGVVTLHLQGSCSHCPSSIMTLKMGVENRLKSLIPEIREVVQI